MQGLDLWLECKQSFTNFSVIFYEMNLLPDVVMILWGCAEAALTMDDILPVVICKAKCHEN